MKVAYKFLSYLNPFSAHTHEVPPNEHEQTRLSLESLFERNALALRDIHSSITSLEGKFERKTRRLSLQSTEIVEHLSEVATLTGEISASVAERDSTSASESTASIAQDTFLPILDGLYKALVAFEDPQSVAVEALTNSIVSLERHFGLIPLSIRGERYHGAECEVAGVVHTQTTEGSPMDAGVVIEILRQGYRCKDGAVVRPAVVIVAGEPREEDEDTSRRALTLEN